MTEWVRISNEMNNLKIADTQTILNSGQVATADLKRDFSFRLSENDFDERGDKKNFSSAVK